MTEKQAKHNRKLHQAINDAVKAMPDSYTLDELFNDLVKLKRIEHMPGERELSTKIIAGLLRWQVENL